MELIYSSEFLLHQTGGHPECPERLSAFEGNIASDIPAGEPYLSLIHSAEHIKNVKDHGKQSIPLNPDTLAGPGSFTAACAAVGAAILAAEQRDFSLGRPPGHHAYPSRSTGFCLFNNIAIAAQHLVNQGKKVMILDIDGHLGDGTSAIFYGSKEVLFCSMHQYPAFPGTGWVDEIGSDAGEGYTINIPMPPGAADDIFWSALEFITPIMRNFDPDIIAVSAGFDGHQFDPLLQLNFSLDGYHKCGSWLLQTGYDVFAVLEGGYNLSVLPEAIDEFHRGVNGINSAHEEKTTLSAELTRKTFDQTLDRLFDQVKGFWNL